MNILNWIYKRIFFKCFIHKVKLQVWGGPRNKYEHGLIEGHVECPECYPELFGDYIAELERFNVAIQKDNSHRKN